MPEGIDLLGEARTALRAAQALFEGGFYGDAVTRAYYAMLYAARALLASKGVAPKSHGGTLQALGRHFVLPGLMGSDLAKAFGIALQSRQRADYGSLTAFTRAQSSEVLASAREFVAFAESLLAPKGP